MKDEIIWNDIIEDGIFLNYQVSNNGLVRNKITGKILKQDISNSGYYRVSIYFNKHDFKHRSVHRLVAIAFIPNPENKREVNHIDGNKLNNNVSNLEWVTRSENEIHAMKTGLFLNSGSNNANSKYLESQIHMVCKLFENKVPSMLISYITKINKNTLRNIRTGRQWKQIFSQYTIISNERYRNIKYSKLKKILLELNIFNNIDLSDLLYSKYIIKKKKLIEDLEDLGYEIFIDSRLYKEL